MISGIHLYILKQCDEHNEKTLRESSFADTLHLNVEITAIRSLCKFFKVGLVTDFFKWNIRKIIEYGYDSLKVVYSICS